MTLIEVLMVLAVLLLFAAIYLSSMPKHPVSRVQCINNLKQVGLATRVWEGDHNDRYPPQEPATNGGSMEYITGPNVWRHFQVMSNELSTPRVVMCPNETDPDRFLSTNFEFFGNSNISFFFGVDANETLPSAFLAGDHNLTNGLAIKDGLLELTTNRPAAWTSGNHNKVGYVCFTDGSVRLTTAADLQTAVATTGLATNRLQMPILSP